MSRFTCTLRGLALVGMLSSCGEREPLAPEPNFATHGSGRFPVVFVTTRSPQRSDGSAPLVASLSDAVTLVRPGGAIVVEAGEWDISGVVINKPLRLIAAPLAAPLLTNNGAGDGLTIDGVAKGTVELRGLRFVNAAGLNAVRALGTYDRVVIRDSRVEVTAPHAGPGTAHGIFASTSTVPDGQLIVESTVFLGGRFGVLAQTTTAHVRNSSFTDCAVASVQYTFGSRGTIANNEIDGCGTNACILLFQPDGIVAVRNRVSHPVGTARHGVRVGSSDPGTYSAFISDNEVVGTGVLPDELDPLDLDGPNAPYGRPINASAFRTGIFARGVVAATVRGNRVSGAHWGIILDLGAAGSITENHVWNCGGLCISVHQPRVATVIEGNLVSGEVGFRRTLIGILAQRQEPAAPVTVRGNTVAGSYNGGDPQDVLSYAFRSGIQAISWDDFFGSLPMVTGIEVEVYGNSVTDVGDGLVSVLGGNMNAHDNQLNGARVGIAAWDGLAVMRANRNDILDAAIAVGGEGDLDARCNWWGALSGPTAAWAPAEVYTPWATEPIANRPLVECG